MTSQASTANGNILYSKNGKVWVDSSEEEFFTDTYGGMGVAAKHLLYGMSPDYYHP